MLDCASKGIAMNLLIRRETANDIDAIRYVNDLAFGGALEGRLVDALRDGGFVRLSLVAEIENRIVGHILFSELHIEIEDSSVPALSLAPMAVLPEFQRRGIGSQLVREGLRLCRDQGHAIVLVVGHPDFYPRFGFSGKLARQLDCPYSGDAFMATELTPKALAGVTGNVIYPAPFASV